MASKCRKPAPPRPNPFAKNLRLARWEKDVTQDEIGKAIKVKRNAVSNYELGKTLPDVLQATAIANALGKSLDELCETEYFKRKEANNRDSSSD